MISPLSSRRRRAARGFTLVELMISLVMGLIVAMAAVALAKSATTSFHEQARSSVTEMAVRMASERLRQDLSRIGYMSTGNIQKDPNVARRLGVPDASVSRYTDIPLLRSVAIHRGETAVPPPPPVAATNHLAPDSIDIVGNLTTDDQYSGTIYTGGCGQIVRLDPMADAAVFALSGGDVGNSAGRFDAAARAAFLPQAGQDFLAQVTDAMGCKHYVPVCSVTLTPGSTGASSYLLIGIDAGKPMSDTGSTTPRGVLYSNSSDTIGLAGNCGSSEMGQVTIAPLSRVRWSLAQNTLTELDPSLNDEPAGNKYNIVRQRYDWTGTVPSGAPEIIAEFGVDLKFGFTYAMPGAPHNIGIADLDSDPALFKSITEDPTLPGARGPQHLRSIRYRVAVRTSVADRDANLTVAPVPYISRYCADTACKKFSRVRTIVSEVALMNQAGMSW